jgi:hypothetical protein
MIKNTIAVSVVCMVAALFGLDATAAGSAPAATPRTLAIQMGAPFHDHAILQRGMKVPVWGWSEPGDTITVEFAGQKKTAKVGPSTGSGQAKWIVWLDPLKASFEPRVMTISSPIGNRQSSIINVLVGEVWLASGQSNMQWSTRKSSVAQIVHAFLEERAAAENGVIPIREFEVTSVTAMLHPIEKATGYWKNGTKNEFSAIAFAFAHKLYKELNVPVGILNCSFSQTPIQAWVPREGFLDGKDDYTKAIYQKILETDPATPEHKAAWSAFYEGIEAQVAEHESLVKQGAAPQVIEPKLPGNMNGNRDASWLYHGRLHPVVPYAIRGAIWNQGYANTAEGYVYYNNLHSLIRGWRMAWDRPKLPVYFHQFYSAGMKHLGKENNTPVIGGMAEMRLGTWMARDIPHTGMASQIDITGGIHYGLKAVPGQRLALHALKNQYGQKDLVVDGPMFKSYTVKGNQLIVEFEHAEGGLVVAETASNGLGRNRKGDVVEGATKFANPTIIENGADQVELFDIADENRVFYPATVKIEGNKVVLTSPKVKRPCGVSYASGGVGFQANLYNQALLPATPFIFFDHEMVLSDTWPDEKLKVDGVEIDPSTIGKLYDYRKMPLLSTQFRDDAILQAGKPITFWGSALHAWGHEAEGEAVIHFSFAPSTGSGQVQVKKTIPVTPGMKEWQVTVPAMKAGTTPYTLKVNFTIDGELAHERVAEGIVFGDVWYVGAPGLEHNKSFTMPEVKESGQIVRMIERQAKRARFASPSRFSVCVSTYPGNRYACRWKDVTGIAAVLGHQLATRSGNPVGVIFMQSSVGRGSTNPELKSWVGPEFLKETPSLLSDYKIIGAQVPGNPYYLDNVRRYLADWKAYWGDYIPEMIATRAVPDGIAWGTYPSMTPSEETTATRTYNVLVESFEATALKGVVFITADTMVAGEQAKTFGPEMSVLANSFKAKFASRPASTSSGQAGSGQGGDDVPFIYSMPTKAVAPSVTAPKGIAGESIAVEVADWKDATAVIEAAVKAAE